MNDLNLHIAQSTRTELDRTNALYFPIHNKWMMISFLVLVLNYVIEAFGQGMSAPLLMLSTMALLPATGAGIKQAALVKRNWALWVSRIGDAKINPDNTSKIHLAAGNIIGSITFGGLLLVVNVGEMYAHLNPGPSGKLQIVCVAFLVLGVCMYALAEGHRPTFTDDNKPAAPTRPLSDNACD